MEPYRQHILPKLRQGRPPHEVEYLDALFRHASPHSESINGPDVVTFFKKSKLEVVSKSRFGFDLVFGSVGYSQADLVASERVKKQDTRP